MWKFLIAFLIINCLTSSCKMIKQDSSIDLEELTIAKIHEAFKEGRFTSEDLVQAYLERIEKYDPQINALSEVNFNALKAAKILDAEFEKTHKLRPLHGIPIIVKDNINTQGLRTSAGSLALQNFIPEDDAFIISKLIDAGAIILAKSNMAEWAFTPWASFSSTIGSTLNAYNQNYSPAGSSGGTGAAIAANFGVIGLGTDTGGSVRLPSASGSIVGFRPTLGLVSRHGIIPCDLRNDTAGPMCRTVEDVVKVLEIISGVDTKDSLTHHSFDKIPKNYTQFLQKDGLKSARIGILRKMDDTEMDSEVSNLFENAISKMEALGAIMMDSIQIPNFDQLRNNQWCENFRFDIENYLKEFVKNDTIKTLEDIIRIGTKSSFTQSNLEYSISHKGREEHSEIECRDAFSDPLRIAFRMAIENYMDSFNLDALIYPSWNIKPYRMDAIIEEYIGANTDVIAPATGQPAITVPMGFMSENLPAGIEFLGRMFSEPTLIKLAYSYEQSTNHRKPPEL